MQKIGDTTHHVQGEEPMNLNNVECVIEGRERRISALCMIKAAYISSVRQLSSNIHKNSRV